MEKIKIAAEQRNRIGARGELSKIRAQKSIPAVLYGAGKAPVAITINEKDLLAVRKAGGNAIVQLALPAGAEEAIIKEVQYHAVTDNPIHIDFQRVSKDKMLETTVPIVLKGDCAFLKTNGGIIDHVLREVHIKCLPADIPHHIEADITNLTLANGITVADLEAPKGVTFIGDAGRIVVHIIIPREEAAAAPAADAAATASQPELSSAKGKKEEEGAAGAAPAKGAAPAAPAKK
ncbi:MAG: 50S ribosomal protein L25 [Elusimicrobiota bacterium]|jgi:large subunit ribosomal protein L25|nr:50S ribosomal protein L25 [Elusimicrobiota bacterium]